MVECRQCGAHKPPEGFYVGCKKCKECVKANVRANYRKNREHYRAYERERSQRPLRKEAAKRYQRKRRSDPVGGLKNSARAEVSRAVRSGELVRRPCEVCGDVKSEAHHRDYTKPLDVQWLCFTHHRQAHGQLM